MIPIPIRDHAGQRRPLYPISFAWVESRRSELPAEVAARIHRQLGERGALDLRSKQNAIATVFVILYLSVSVTSLIMNRGRDIWGFAVATAVFILMLTAVLATARLRGRKQIIAVMLSEKRCASCAYDLSTAAHDERGLTTCPECGAKWIVPEATG